MIDAQQRRVLEVVAHARDEVVVPRCDRGVDELRRESPVLSGGEEHVGRRADGYGRREEIALPPRVEPVGMGPERKVEPEQAATRRDVLAQLEQVFVHPPLRVLVHLDRGSVEPREVAGPAPPVATVNIAHGPKPCVVDRLWVVAQEVVERGAPTGREGRDLVAQRGVCPRERRRVVDKRRGGRQRIETAEAQVQFVPEEPADR